MVLKPLEIVIGDELQLVVSDKMRNFRTELEQQQLEHAVREGRMATILIEKWGTVAADTDGEDSAGRSKLRLQTPEEIVQRACDTAALACAEFRKRGWIIPVPPTYELDDEYLEKFGDESE